MDKEQLLRNPDVYPSDEILAEALGAAYEVYTEFVKELERYGFSFMDWRFYNDGKSWLSKGEYRWTTPRGTNKIKPIFWLSIWNGFFRVAFFFGFDIKNELLELSISQNAKELIGNAEPMGKTMRFLPIVFDVSNEEQLNDLYVLSEFRKASVK